MANGALGGLLAYIDNLKRVGSRNLRDLVQSPNEYGEMAASRFDQNMKERMADPTSALDFVAGPAGGLAGVIRRGGRTDLNMVHNVSSPELFLDLLRGRGSMSNPSVAIAKNEVFPFEQSPSLVLNPNSPLFDPAQHRGNQLFNRDAYTFRARTLDKIPEGVRSYRGDPRKWGADMRGTEGINLNNPAQDFAMYASPRFRSFAEFEKSPSGAGALSKMTSLDKQFSQDLNQIKNEWLEKNIGNPHFSAESAVRLLREAAKSGDAEAAYILKAAREIPSDYAELKVLGEVPINKRNVSAVILPQNTRKSQLLRYQDEIPSRTGIPTGRPSDLMPPEMLGVQGRLETYLNNAMAGRLRQMDEGKILPEEVYGGLSQFAKRYLDQGTVDDLISMPSYTEEIIRKRLPYSSGVAADIANYYTTR